MPKWQWSSWRKYLNDCGFLKAKGITILVNIVGSCCVHWIKSYTSLKIEKIMAKYITLADSVKHMASPLWIILRYGLCMFYERQENALTQRTLQCAVLPKCLLKCVLLSVNFISVNPFNFGCKMQSLSFNVQPLTRGIHTNLSYSKFKQFLSLVYVSVFMAFMFHYRPKLD